MIAFIITSIHSFGLGLPLFLVLQKKFKTWGMGKSLLVAILVGFAVGIIPWGVFTWPLKLSLLIMKNNTWIGPEHVQTVKDGIPTAAGWLSYFKSLLLFGPFGALGGFVFWATLKLLGGLPSTRQQEVVEGDTPSLMTPLHKSISLLASAIIIILTVAICAIPAIAADRSCHNMFRDGRPSIGPVVHWDLQIGDNEWPKFKELLQSFATTNNMSFRDESDVKPGVVRTLYLSACNEDGVNIEIVEQRWASENYVDTTSPGVSIGIYITKDEADWVPLTKELIAKIETQWPHKIQFRGDRGEIVPKPGILEESP